MTAKITNNGGSQFDVTIGGIVIGTFDATGFVGVKNASIDAAKLATAVLPLGVGQTWQNMAASRSYGAFYTNTTGRTIAVSLVGNSSAVALVTASVGGATLFSQSVPASYNQTITLIVPNGAAYAVSWSGGTLAIISWDELRA